MCIDKELCLCGQLVGSRAAACGFFPLSLPLAVPHVAGQLVSEGEACERAAASVAVVHGLLCAGEQR